MQDWVRGMLATNNQRGRLSADEF